MLLNDYIKIDDYTCRIYLKGKQNTIVDIETLEELLNRPCKLYIGCKKGYCHVWFRDTKERKMLHRWIMQPLKHLTVDHINCKRRDNRRKNLQIVTRAENTKLRHRRTN